MPPTNTTPRHLAEWCDRHGGTTPFPAPACPDCHTGSAGAPADPVGAATGVTFDAETVHAAANEAACCADALRATLAAARPGLDAVPGRFQTVIALRSRAVAQHADATALADRVGAVATKLTDTVSDYLRRDADLAASLDAILPV